MHAVRPSRVFVDANVWYSRVLRDWLGLLYTLPDDPPFTVLWSEDVLAELIHNLRRRHTTWEGARITGIRDRLTETFSVGRVANFTVDGSYRGPDELDAHIHAAATAGDADVLLTANVADFDWDDNQSEYDVMAPDDFLVLLDDSHPHLVYEAAEQMCRYWLARDGEADLPRRLRQANCPGFAQRVQAHLRSIDFS